MNVNKIMKRRQKSINKEYQT